MFNAKLASAKTFVKDHNIEIGMGAMFIGITALAIKYPEMFDEAPRQPDQIIKIIHVHE